MSTEATPKATRRQARFSKKRALIIRSAAQAFGRKGFHATTLDEIAADLDVTKALLCLAGRDRPGLAAALDQRASTKKN